MNEECDGKCGSCSMAEGCTDSRKEKYEEEQRLQLKMNSRKRGTKKGARGRDKKLVQRKEVVR